MPLSKIETRSNEMEEVVGNIPSWIIRWGIATLFCIMILFLFISNFIKYPDTLSGKAIIQAKNQPGKITIQRTDASQHYKFYVKDGDKVNPGDTLLIQFNDTSKSVAPIITPMKGKIFISEGTDENNTLDQFIWVVPPSSQVNIKIKYSNKGAGDVQVGKKVKIELNDFPQHEYGYLEGKIISVMPLQIDGERQAYVQLDGNKLVTSTNKELPVLPIMQGSAEIILNNKSIFQRVFRSIF